MGAGSEEHCKLTQAHVDCSLASTLLADNVVGSPVEAVKNDGSAARFTLENLDRKDAGLLGNTISLASNGAGNVGTVANGVLMLAAGSVVGLAGAALELLVVDIDTAIHDVGKGALAGTGVIDVVGALLALVGNASQTPGGTLLGGQTIEVVDLVLLDVGNLGTS